MSVFHTEQGNKYQFNSSGEVAQTIELVSGQTYTFSLASSALNHPFKFSETSDGVHAGGVSYNNGVTYTQGTDTFSFVPEKWCFGSLLLLFLSLWDGGEDSDSRLQQYKRE